MAIPSPYLTVDDLVAAVVRGARLPQSQATLTATDIAALMDEEQDTSVGDLIHVVREDYWLANYDQQITANVYSYAMHKRAVMGGLRDVVFVDASGNEIEVAHLSPDQLKTPANSGYRPGFAGQGIYLQNDKVVLWPQNYNNTAYLLRQKYERRPNTLTLIANCAQVTAVGSNQVTVTTYPTTDWIIGTTLDIISNRPQFVSWADDLAITGFSGTGPYTITFASMPTTVTVGSWLCPAETTCIPQIPAEAYSLLSALGIMRVHMAMQNSNGFQVAAKLVEDNRQAVLKMLTPRVEGSPQKFVNRSSRVGLLGFPNFR